MQDLKAAGQERETTLRSTINLVEAALGAANARCTELDHRLQTATASMAALLADRDTLLEQLTASRAHAAGLQASGRVSATTSEVCRVALTQACMSHVAANTDAQNLKERLEAELSNRELVAAELQGCRRALDEAARKAEEQGAELQGCWRALEEAEQELEQRAAELAAVRAAAAMAQEALGGEMEQLAGKLCATEDRLEEALVSAASFKASSDRGASAAAEQPFLKVRVAEAEAQVEVWRQRAAEAQDKAAGAQAQLGLAAAQAGAARVEADEARQQTVSLMSLLREAAHKAEAAREHVEGAVREAREARTQVEEWRARAGEAEEAQEAAATQVEEWRARAGEAEQAQEAAATRVEELETDAAAWEQKEQSLSSRAAQLQSQVEALHVQLLAGSHTNRGREEQLKSMHANEAQLLQRILAGEAERQQLLRQIDEGNGTVADLRQRLDEATQLGAEVPELRSRLAGVTATAEQLAEAAAVSAARLAEAAAEQQRLRAELRSAEELYAEKARAYERRAQQLAALREQVLEHEQAQAGMEADNRVLRLQVSENGRLRTALSLATAPRPRADACTSMESGSGPLAGGSCEEGHGRHGATLPGAAAAVAAAAWSAVPRRRRRAAGPVGSNGLSEVPAIPEDEGRQVRASHGRRRPLRVLVGLMLKGVLLAGGMAAGLALGNPRGGGSGEEQQSPAVGGGSGEEEAALGGRSGPGQQTGAAVEGGVLPTAE